MEDTAALSEQIPRGSGASGRNKAPWLAALLVATAGMFGFAYANAELFVMLCQEVGLIAADPNAVRGTIGERELGREIEVYFSATTNDSLPIEFATLNRYQRMRLGERMLNEYRFRNKSDRTIYFRPVHDVQPARAGSEEALVLEKCFCFDEQKIGPGESYTLPIVYTLTEEIGDKTNVVTMRYSLFESTRERYEAFMESQKETAP